MSSRYKAIIVILLLLSCLFESCDHINLHLVFKIFIGYIIIMVCMPDNPIFDDKSVLLGIFWCLLIFFIIYFGLSEFYQRFFPPMTYGWFAIVILSMFVYSNLFFNVDYTSHDYRYNYQSEPERRGSRSENLGSYKDSNSSGYGDDSGGYGD